MTQFNSNIYTDPQKYLSLSAKTLLNELQYITTCKVSLEYNMLLPDCSNALRQLFNLSCIYLFVCLFGFNVDFKHLRSYQDGACL